MYSSALSKNTARPVKPRNLLYMLGLASAAGSLGLAIGSSISSGFAESTVGAAGLLVYLLAIALDPLIGLFLWLVTAPFAHWLLVDLDLGESIPDLNLSRVIPSVLMLIILAQAAAGRRKLVWHRALDVLIVIAIIGIGQSVASSITQTTSAMLFLDAYVVPFVIYFVAKNLASQQRSINKLLVTALIIGVYVSGLAIREQLTGEVLFDLGPGNLREYSRHVRRLTSLLGNPSFFGAVLDILVPICLYGALTARNPGRKILFTVATTVMCVGVFLTFNRASYFGMIFGLIVMSWFSPSLGKTMAIFVIILGGVIATQWDSIANSPIIKERLFWENPVEARIVLYPTSLNMFVQNPIRGLGFDNFRHYILAYAVGLGDIPATAGSGSPSPHNSFLYVLTSAGLLGLIPYVGIFITLIYYVVKLLSPSAHRPSTDRHCAAILLAVVGAYVLTSSSQDVVYAFFVNQTFFAVVGYMLGRLHRVEQPITRPGCTEALLSGGTAK